MTQLYPDGRRYAIGHPTRLTPHEVRTRTFTTQRRGIDPHQVREFQLRLADELAALRQEVAMVSQENDRLKRALRDWQSTHARTCRQPDQRFPTNPGYG